MHLIMLRTFSFILNFLGVCIIYWHDHMVFLFYLFIFIPTFFYTAPLASPFSSQHLSGHLFYGSCSPPCKFPIQPPLSFWNEYMVYYSNVILWKQVSVVKINTGLRSKHNSKELQTRFNVFNFIFSYLLKIPLFAFQNGINISDSVGKILSIMLCLEFNRKSLIDANNSNGDITFFFFNLIS